jgi:V8-like Glu-specific endopeptidase
LLGLVLQTPPASADSGAGAPGSAGPKAAQERSSSWTAERMRSATSLDLLDVGSGAVKDAGKTVPRGEELKIPPLIPGGDDKAAPQGGGAWSGGGDVVNTTGRVFFKLDGKDASCSGNAVTSDNASTVMTAGHCVQMQGKWHTNWTFVPGYHDGKAPHGKWSAGKKLTTPQWDAGEDNNYDIGAAVVKPLDGKRLTDVVGGQGLSFNAPYNSTMYAFGFPAADPYDGEKLTYCNGTAFEDFLLSKDHGIPCNMTGGASGGPWFTEFDEASGTGLQSSVNSFKYNFMSNAMFGPYFGKDAQKLYERAQAG